MGFLSFLSSGSKSGTSPKTKTNSNRSSPQIESLEDRLVLSGNTISGTVFHDLNNNGIMEAGEPGIAFSQIELHDATGAVVASDITDTNGNYDFTRDERVPTTDQTLTHTITFPEAQTNFQLSDVVPQFDPTLGTLHSVKIIHEGAIISEIQVENTSQESTSDIEATVEGMISLQGGGVTDSLTISDNAGTFQATKYDGATDFDGNSGHSFSPHDASATNEILLTGNQMQPFMGNGTVTFTETAVATSFAKGGGNLVASLLSKAEASVTVIYTYTPDDRIQPGDYEIIQVTQPNGFEDGQESTNGVALNNPPGVDIIPVTLTDADSIGNNFGEYKLAELSGFVYEDDNNDGIFQSGTESGIGGVEVTLTGRDHVGVFTSSTTTAADGSYIFTGLRPATYTVTETQPATYLDGKDTIGNISGTKSNDRFDDIQLRSGDQSQNNNFGELKPIEISGRVYEDDNNNGNFDFGPPNFEAGIAGVEIQLTGADDLGAVSLVTTTDGNGDYSFDNLRPGTYTISESQPAGYLDGKDTIGNISGTVVNDAFANLTLHAGDNSHSNDFGELKPAKLSGYVFEDDNDNGVKDAGEAGIDNVTITLTGVNDFGPVNFTTTTTTNSAHGAGYYEFTELRPGVYSIRQTQPANYDDGQDHLGTLGGSKSNDLFTQIVVAAGANGENYNFGEIVITSADLGIVKSTQPDTALVGEQFTYTLTVSNNGVDPAENVVVTDNLPPQATFVSAGAPGWSSTQNGTLVTFTTPTLLPGESRTITIVVQAPMVVGLLTNTTEVTSDTPDPDLTNNTSTVTNLVVNQPGEIFPNAITPLQTTVTTAQEPPPPAPPPPPPVISKSLFFYGNTQPVAPAPQAPVPAQTQSMPSIANQTFVDGIFRSILGRPSDRDTQLHWARELDNGGMSREQAILNLWFSDEHRSRQVNSLYQTFLDRNPTQVELNNAIQRLNNWTPESQLAIELMSSAEYMATHPTTAGLIAGFYQDLTNQIPDAASLQLQSQTMATTPTQDMARLIMNSDAGLREIVDRGFRNVLRRNATNAEVQHYSQLIRTDQMTPSRFMRSLLESDEFFDLALNSRVM